MWKLVRLPAESAASRFPSHAAVVDEQGSLTFQELQAKVEQLAAGLFARHALRPGHRVALLCRNHRDLVIALIALSRLGVDVLLLGTESPRAVLQRILGGQALRPILHDAEFAELLTGAPSPCQVIEDIQADCPPRLPRTRKAGRILLLTSGSTGAAKSIARRPTLRSLLPVLAGLVRFLPLRMHAPAVSALPLYHGYGLAVVAMALLFGAPLYLARRCDVGPLLECLAEGAPPAVLISVPTLLERWIATKPFVIPPLAAVITGSAPLSPKLCRRLLECLGPRLFNLYGSTEAGIIALATPDVLLDALGPWAHRCRAIACESPRTTTKSKFEGLWLCRSRPASGTVPTMSAAGRARAAFRLWAFGCDADFRRRRSILTKRSRP